jgi:uncharacterized membrane protein YesL
MDEFVKSILIFVLFGGLGYLIGKELYFILHIKKEKEEEK